MEVGCDLQVDVNGQELFFVDKKILSSFSNKISSLFGNLRGTNMKLKVIFNDFPGGAEGFELIARFCYNNGRIEMTPANIVLLNCAANYLEMNSVIFGPTDLKDQLEDSLELINCWTCSELFVALRQCQDLLPAPGSECIIQRLLDALAGKLAFHCDSSEYTSSSDSSRFQFSCDTRSTETLKKGCSQTTWWFEDLMFLKINLIEKAVETMVSHKLDHTSIRKFIFYYQKSRFTGAATADQKRKVTEAIINMLCLLDRSSVSCKGLLGIFRVASSLKISKCCKNKLESLIVSQLDQVTLDDLLVPSSYGKNSIYDVSLVLRLLKLFVLEARGSSPRLKKVGALIDLYAMEVAPDFNLKPSLFGALAMALPDDARDCHDGMYRVIDMYFEVHRGLCEEEKTRLCCALNYEKLSADALKHLAQNSKFPSRTLVAAFVALESKLKNPPIDTHFPKAFSELPLYYTDKTNTGKEDGEKILNMKKLNFLLESEKLGRYLQRMQCRMMELEKLGRKIQTQMANMMKSRPSNSELLPKLCS